MNNNFMVDRLIKQKNEIDNLIQSYQNIGQPTPVNNFITSSQPQTQSKDLIEWRILNENEEVDNLYVQNKTLFINDNLMVLKGVDGSLEKWEVKKIYPIDKKDEKINELTLKIEELERRLNNESTKSDGTIREFEQSDESVNVNVESKSKTTGKSISKQK